MSLLAVVTWVGGTLFIALVLVPITRRLEDATLRTRLVQDTGRRFRAGRPGPHPSARVRASRLARVNVLVALAIVALGLALRG